MNGSPPPPNRRLASWWSRRWLWLALALALGQAGVFYVLSPKAPGKLGTRLAPPQQSPLGSFSVRAAVGATEWQWLLTPGVFLLPSAYGFSGAAWLRPEPVELPVGQVTVGSQPLPYNVASLLDPPPALLPRADAGPALRSRVPAGDSRLPEVGGVPLPTSGRIRMISGPPGWKPMLADGFPAPGSEAGPLLPTIIRVLVGTDGEIQAPPVVWRGSGSAEADGRALAVVDQLTPGFTADSGESRDVPAGTASFAGIAFLAVEWGCQPVSSPNPSSPTG